METIPKTHIKNLPSGHVPYPDGTSILIRPYTLAETRRLSGDLTPREAFEIILEGITIESDETLDKLDLTLSDVGFLAISRKVLTVGQDGTVDVSTKQDGVEYRKSVNLSEISFDELKVSALPITVSGSLGGRTDVQFHPPTVRQLLQLSKWFPGKEDDEVYVLASMVTTDKGELPRAKKDFEDNVEFVGGLAGEDMALIEVINEELEHGIKPIELPAVKGKGKGSKSVTVSLSGSNFDFFRPEGGGGVDLRSRLRFGA